MQNVNIENSEANANQNKEQIISSLSQYQMSVNKISQITTNLDNSINDNKEKFKEITFNYLRDNYNLPCELNDNYYRDEDVFFLYDLLLGIAMDAGFEVYRDDFVESCVGYNPYYMYNYNCNNNMVRVLVDENGHIFDDYNK